jgi:hypothetical protein
MKPLQTAGIAMEHGDPLAVAWLSHAVEPLRAGAVSTVRVAFANAGSATWRSRGEAGVLVSAHWLDELGNAVIWDCLRTPLARPVPPGERAEVTLQLRAPMPPGSYVLAFDLVEEHEFWFSEVGVPMLEVPCRVESRLAERRLGVVVHPGPGDEGETRMALAHQHEPIVVDEPAAVAHLIAGAVPDPTWSQHVLDAHDEGFAAVGAAVQAPGGVHTRHNWSWLRPWRPQPGRNPRFSRPLLLPSLVNGLEPTTEHGWPAFAPAPDVVWDLREPALFDGRTVVRLRPRSDRPRT